MSDHSSSSSVLLNHRSRCGRRKVLAHRTSLRVTTTSIILLSLCVGNSISGGPPVEEPEFAELIENITVPAGREVKLACSVKNLGSHKVAWIHFEGSAILTVQTHVITRNPRIKVTHDKHRTWYLHIEDVQQSDAGRYMCQINTEMAKTQFGYLHVVGKFGRTDIPKKKSKSFLAVLAIQGILAGTAGLSPLITLVDINLNFAYQITKIFNLESGSTIHFIFVMSVQNFFIIYSLCTASFSMVMAISLVGFCIEFLNELTITDEEAFTIPSYRNIQNSVHLHKGFQILLNQLNGAILNSLYPLALLIFMMAITSLLVCLIKINSNFLVNVAYAMLMFGSIGYLYCFVYIVSLIVAASEQYVLESQVKCNTKYLQQLHRAIHPYKVNAGQFVNVDAGLTLVVFDAVINNTVNVLLGFEWN